MIAREAFLKALTDDEDDIDTRLIYADWLEENGESEEADRQRRWPAAKGWLVKFCELTQDDDSEYNIFRPSYEEMVRLARQALKETGEGQSPGIHCRNNVELQDRLYNHKEEFWHNVSILTGIPLPPATIEGSYFRCSC